MMFSILNMEFSDRVKQRMKALGITAVDLAAKVGVSKGAITHWTNGTNQAGGQRLMRLAEALECEAAWLISGKASLFKSSSGRLHIVPSEDVETPAQGQHPDSPSEKDYALIPQFKAHGSCGNGYLNDHVEVTEGLVFKRDWLARMKAKPENLNVIYAEGDSMEPYVFEGDVVLFDRSATEPRDRQAYVIRRPDGGLSIKRLIQQISGGWLIRSDNTDKSKYPDEQLSEDALHEIPILGRVIWRGGEM